jgi:hypothetical protein
VGKEGWDRGDGAVRALLGCCRSPSRMLPARPAWRHPPVFGIGGSESALRSRRISESAGRLRGEGPSESPVTPPARPWARHMQCAPSTGRASRRTLGPSCAPRTSVGKRRFSYERPVPRSEEGHGRRGGGGGGGARSVGAKPRPRRGEGGGRRGGTVRHDGGVGTDDADRRAMRGEDDAQWRRRPSPMAPSTAASWSLSRRGVVLRGRDAIRAVPSWRRAGHGAGW